jgi:hypothetical protein
MGQTTLQDVKFEKLMVNPAMAEDMLVTAGYNRTVSHDRVLTWANAMRSGKWEINGQTVVFSKTGKLVDGQHRLFGIVISGCTVPLLIVRGVSDDAFETIDTGKPRSGGDIAGMAGYTNSTLQIATAGIIWKLWHLAGLGDTVTPETALRVLERYPEIEKWAALTKHPPKPITIPPAPFAAACVYLDVIAGNPDGAKRFFDGVSTGVGVPIDDPRLILRNRMLNMRGAGQVMSVINCWSPVSRIITAIEQGEVLKRLQVDAGGGQIKRPYEWERHVSELPAHRRLDDLSPQAHSGGDQRAKFKEYVEEIRETARARDAKASEAQIGRAKPKGEPEQPAA